MPHWVSQLLGALVAALGVASLHQVKDLKLGKYSSRLLGVIAAAAVWVYLYWGEPNWTSPYLPILVGAAIIVQGVIYAAQIRKNLKAEFRTILESKWLFAAMIAFRVAYHLFAR